MNDNLRPPSNRAMKWLLNALFGIYHIVISPLLGRNCRYSPSCSVYTKQAIELHGWFKGCYLGIKRIACCQPWGGDGFDPVPGSPEALLNETVSEIANKAPENN